MVILVMRGVHVGTAILPHLSLFEFVGVVSRWTHGLAISLDADRGLDVLLRDAWVDGTRSKHRVGQIRCPCRERKCQCKADSYDSLREGHKRLPFPTGEFP